MPEQKKLGEVPQSLRDLVKDMKPGVPVSIPHSVLAEIDSMLEPGFSQAMKEAREKGGTIYRQHPGRTKHHGY